MTRYMNICWAANYHGFFTAPDHRSRLTWRGRFADVPSLTEMFNFYSSGDEVLEIDTSGVPYAIETVWDFASPLIGFDADVRRNTWQKQEFYKGRSWIYGTGWAGWGFESNVTATAVNAAAPATLRDAPIFEHDPDEMFSATITTNMQNSILAKGIPALSGPMGGKSIGISTPCADMNSYGNGNWWMNRMNAYRGRWLHSDIQNLSFFFSWRIFKKIVDEGNVK